MKYLATKPPVGGMPVRESRKIIIKVAGTGFLKNRPRMSSMRSPIRFERRMPVTTAKAPRVIMAYTKI